MQYNSTVTLMCVVLCTYGYYEILHVVNKLLPMTNFPFIPNPYMVKYANVIVLQNNKFYMCVCNKVLNEKWISFEHGHSFIVFMAIF